MGFGISQSGQPTGEPEALSRGNATRKTAQQTGSPEQDAAKGLGPLAAAAMPTQQDGARAGFGPMPGRRRNRRQPEPSPGRRPGGQAEGAAPLDYFIAQRRRTVQGARKRAKPFPLTARRRCATPLAVHLKPA